MFGRPRGPVLTACVLFLWVLPAMAGLAMTVHASHHVHEHDYPAEDPCLSVSEWLSHGHEHSLDTPEHEHPAVSAATEPLRPPRRDLGAQIATAKVASDGPSPRSSVGGRQIWDWLAPAARPSPSSALHLVLCVLLR